ncbi:MAG: hypothetical protein IT247_06885 [Bacteroidia bacterium]|nr:hypothetical protein [Bacteroidia bacterium]
MKQLKNYVLLLLIFFGTQLIAQDVKNIYSVRPGFSFPIGDFNDLANPMYNYQIDWQHYFNTKSAFGFGFLSGGNKFDANQAAQNVLSNTPLATLATVAADNYKYTAVYGMATYNFTPNKKMAVEFTTRLGVCFSRYPSLSVYADDPLYIYINAEESSANATSFYYTGALVFRYPLSEKFDLSFSNEVVGFAANYTIKGTDYLTSNNYTAKAKQNYNLVFTSIGLNWKFYKK